MACFLSGYIALAFFISKMVVMLGLLSFTKWLFLPLKGFQVRALKISCLYLLFGSLWILLSDYYPVISDLEVWKWPHSYQTLKGLFFVFVTSFLLFLVLKRVFEKQENTNQETLEKERQYKHLLNHLPGFAYRCYFDEDWTMDIVSNACYHLTGYHSEEMLHNCKVSFASIIDPRDRKTVFDKVNEAVKVNQSFSICYRIRTKQGEVRWVWEQGSMAFEQNGNKFLEGYITDVTKVYDLKEKLGVMDVYYKLLLENANDAIFVVNFDQVNGTLAEFKEVNSLACERLQLSREELLQMNPSEISIFKNAVDLQAGLNTLKSTNNYTFETTYLSSEGYKRYSEVNAHLFESNEEAIVMAISRDVTDRVVARRMLEEKNQELRTLLYKSSHDLRSPTTNILGLTEIARAEAEDQQTPHYLDLIHQSAKQTLYILESLDTASRAKKNQVGSEPIDFQQIVDQVLQKLATLPGYSNVKFTREVDTNQTIYSDPALLQYMLYHLLSNSIHYQSNDNPQVHIEIQLQNEEAKIAIKDNGPGISKDVQSQIYQMFYRGHEYSKGSGLGLYIVKNAVEKLNGTIYMESDEGKGTSFQVFIPAKSFHKNGKTTTAPEIHA